MAQTDPNIDPSLNEDQRRVWALVSASPVANLWKIEGISFGALIRRIIHSVIEDRLFGHAAELGFYFLFSLFPTLICASSMLGLAARSAHHIYSELLDYLALVLPTSALSTVLQTFNQTTAASTSGKITFGLIAAIWSASVGISACQDTLNEVYKIVERRSYIKARLCSIALTIVLIVTISLCLGSMFAGDFAGAWCRAHLQPPLLGDSLSILTRVLSWVLATAFLSLSFALIYYWAPALHRSRWRWLTPGTTIAILGWLLASIGFRIYLHFFNTYSVTYGSLGAVIILLMWFYITGLMLLLGAEINSEIEAAAVEAKVIPSSNARHPERAAPAA